jgi:ADP-ribosylglycohydrolase
MNTAIDFKFIHEEKFRAAFWGFIVGDAIGVPYEFYSREEMKLSPAYTMTGYGTYEQPIGTWSDDTSMMLCVLENISTGRSVQVLAKLFLKWADEGYHTAHHEVFDMGNTTRVALERIRMGVNLDQVGCFDEKSAGNGSLMRSLPYAFVDPIEYAIESMLIEGRLTHRLDVCSDASLLYINMIRNLAAGKEKFTALSDACLLLQTTWKHQGRFGEQQDTDKFSRLFMEEFHMLPEQEIKSTGYVIHTIEASIWCFLNSRSYTETVLKAVNLGGDTDTIAAIAGGLAGTYYGINNIPEEWLNLIARREELEGFFQKWIYDLN